MTSIYRNAKDIIDNKEVSTNLCVIATLYMYYSLIH